MEQNHGMGIVILTQMESCAETRAGSRRRIVMDISHGDALWQ